VLLDTHVFLWWNDGNPKLSKKVRQIMADPENTLVLSVASAWEIAIKAQLGKLRIPGNAATWVPNRAAHDHMVILPINLAHAVALESLPLHHRDPFDRILIVQSQIEKLPILTHDQAILAYHVEAIW
jgi:PIN domain nuclease of toxin-antitoxin system